MFWSEITSSSGASLTALTEIENCWEIVSVPSVILNVIILVPDMLSFGFIVIFLSTPVMSVKGLIKISSADTNNSFADSICTVNKSVKSLSKGCIIKLMLLSSSFTVPGSETAVKVGISLTLFIVTVKLIDSDSPPLPSFAYIVIWASPTWFESGKIDNVEPETLISTSVELATKVILSSPSTSVAFNSIERDSSSWMLWFGIRTITGASFVGVIFKLNVPRSCKGGSGKGYASEQSTKLSSDNITWQLS